MQDLQLQEIEILRDTVCGGQRVSVGDVVPASGRDATLLISMGKARLAEPEPEAKKGPKAKAKKAPANKQVTSDELENR